MPKINLAGVVSGVQKVLDAVQDIAPIAEKLGGPSVANVATLAIAATAVIENVLARANDTNVAMTTQDETKLRAMLAELQAANDRLAGAIGSD